MKKILMSVVFLVAASVSMAMACGSGDCQCSMKKSHDTTASSEGSSDSGVSGNGGNFAKGSTK